MSGITSHDPRQTDDFVAWAMRHGYYWDVMPIDTNEKHPGVITLNDDFWVPCPTTQRLVFPLVEVDPTTEDSIYITSEKILCNNHMPMKMRLEYCIWEMDVTNPRVLQLPFADQDGNIHHEDATPIPEGTEPHMGWDENHWYHSDSFIVGGDAGLKHEYYGLPIKVPAGTKFRAVIDPNPEYTGEFFYKIFGIRLPWQE